MTSTTPRKKRQVIEEVVKPLKTGTPGADAKPNIPKPKPGGLVPQNPQK